MEQKTKHTPGPWQVRSDNLGVCVADNNLLHPNEARTETEDNGGSDDYFVADCAESLYARPTDECAANANLIAAAPDLLLACEVILKLLEDNQGEAGWYLKGHYNKLQRAIDKAKGRLYE